MISILPVRMKLFVSPLKTYDSFLFIDKGEYVNINAAWNDSDHLLTTVMWIVQLMTDRSRYFNTSKNYWFSFNTFLISLIGLYFRVVLINTARPDGAKC
jgi:hypothetical protein